MENETPTKPDAKPAEAPEEPPIRTQHTIFVGGKTLKYTATAGLMPLKNEQGETEARIFFIAYTLDEPDGGAQRPLTFAFNGGPGSASIWLHLGALGPRRVQMQSEGWMPAPPYKLVDNDSTWLDQTDLVFVDPVGTGYSRAAKPDLNKKYWNFKGDLESTGEFIRLYLTRYERWGSPLFLAGESYGTTRSGGLAGHLIDKGIAFNGILLISMVLNFQTLVFNRGNDLPFTLYTPTYTATAWYHKKLAQDLLDRPLPDVLAEVEAWTTNEYTVALMRSDRLSDSERQTIIEQLARYTGLSTEYIDQTNLRVDIGRFCKQLLRDQKRTVGRLDSRFKGVDANATTERFEFDPSLTSIMPPYTAMMNDYARGKLEFKSDLEYHALSFEVNGAWQFESGEFPDTSEALRSAFAKNPFMKVMVAQGYYDLATPHLAAQYTIGHMDLHPEARDQVTMSYYNAGHMFYLDIDSLAKFRDDVRTFIQSALAD